MKLKIGLLSDSHDKTALTLKAVEFLGELGAEFLLHAGDITDFKTLSVLKKSSLPYAAVFGNNDRKLFEHAESFNIHKEPYYFNLGELKIKMMHHPFYLSPDADLIVYGHTHFFKAEEIGGKLFLCPGEICGKKRGLFEFVLLETDKTSWKVSRYYKNGEKGDFAIFEEEFKRI